MSSGALNAGVTQLKEGKNEFMFIIRPANTSIYGAYYLNINYTAVDMSLDRLEVRPDAITEDPIEFKGKDFKPNVFDYEINIDNSKDQYIFVADAQEALKSVKEKGISETLKIYIGSDYNDIYDLQTKSTPVTEGGENPVTRAYTPSELELDEYGYAEVR